MQQKLDKILKPMADIPKTMPAIPDGMILFGDFLVSTPPEKEVTVSDALIWKLSLTEPDPYVATPLLRIHCDWTTCSGERIFSTPTQQTIEHASQDVFIYYYCRNCQRTLKTFALRIKRPEGRQTHTQVRKLGEEPPFGPPTPSRIFKLIGEEYRTLFLQGRRAENRGLGIGAYAYYRRIVEHQKGRIIEEIRKVAEKLGAPQDVLDTFAAARDENQFTKAIGVVKDGFPQSLFIEGRNPLLILHNALSDGIHERTDEECLEDAVAIRLVLVELAERLAAARKEDAQLKDAVKRLLNRNTPTT